ncbi:putative metalloprotease CJM1_0395 family protein [Halarcobacter sp.]|uniref:putative metalloprotease CJM1_0395 family protein n=1 Tax=Halarcobacter sp. TaxID=2321133 RepID=UPI0029F469CD|nr:putative metalloprotease CJM1_0395 family protein [Halarcobacter sp.]
MEALNTTQSASSIYMQLAQKRAELASVDKKELEKSTQDSYDKTASSSKYDEKDYERVIEKFKNLDSETKAHEQLHASRAATTTPINYNYQVGPDGKLYATGGSVRFDTSIPDDEASANLKLQQLQDAASGPSELSSADAQIARTANLNRLLLQSQEQGVENDS